MKYTDIPKPIRDRMNVDELIFGNAFCLLEDGKYKRIDPITVNLMSNGNYKITGDENGI